MCLPLFFRMCFSAMVTKKSAECQTGAEKPSLHFNHIKQEGSGHKLHLHMLGQGC